MTPGGNQGAPGSGTDLGVDAPEQLGQPIPELSFRELDFGHCEPRERLVWEAAMGRNYTPGTPREGVQPFEKRVIICTSAVGSLGHEPGL